MPFRLNIGTILHVIPGKKHRVIDVKPSPITTFDDGKQTNTMDSFLHTLEEIK